MKNHRSLGTSRGMRAWYSRLPKCRTCRDKYLVETYARERGYCAGCFKKAIPIEDGEWHCAGNFIQKSEHPALFGKYEVFRDDEKQSHIGRYETFNEAKKAARENATERPLNGAAKYLY